MAQPTLRAFSQKELPSKAPELSYGVNDAVVDAVRAGWAREVKQGAGHVLDLWFWHQSNWALDSLSALPAERMHERRIRSCARAASGSRQSGASSKCVCTSLQASTVLQTNPETNAKTAGTGQGVQHHAVPFVTWLWHARRRWPQLKQVTACVKAQRHVLLPMVQYDYTGSMLAAPISRFTRFTSKCHGTHTARPRSVRGFLRAKSPSSRKRQLERVSMIHRMWSFSGL